jgi:hypothetical protein
MRELDPDAKIERRIGSTPQQRGSLNNGTCPDVFELTSGDFAIIGDDCPITDEVAIVDAAADLNVPADADA